MIKLGSQLSPDLKVSKSSYIFKVPFTMEGNIGCKHSAVDIFEGRALFCFLWGEQQKRIEMMGQSLEN